MTAMGITVLGRLMALPLRAYRLAVSPLLGVNCRFHPSCSDYAAEALESHGAIKGLWLGARRVARCNPWGGEGYDPVPAPRRAPQR
jgi:hypothetical protein